MQEHIPCAKARELCGRLNVQAEARTYHKGKGNNKNKYGDSGFARMTSKRRMMSKKE
jgi:hypothetical protein